VERRSSGFARLAPGAGGTPVRCHPYFELIRNYGNIFEIQIYPSFSQRRHPVIKNEQKRQREPVVMSMVNDQCVWGRAGVIKPIKCINAFDCLGCTMDQRVLANFEEKEALRAKKTKGPPECSFS
jgi:hypothetical protein